MCRKAKEASQGISACRHTCWNGSGFITAGKSPRSGYFLRTSTPSGRSMTPPSAICAARQGGSPVSPTRAGGRHRRLPADVGSPSPAIIPTIFDWLQLQRVKRTRHVLQSRQRHAQIWCIPTCFATLAPRTCWTPEPISAPSRFRSAMQIFEPPPANQRGLSAIRLTRRDGVTGVKGRLCAHNLV